MLQDQSVATRSSWCDVYPHNTVHSELQNERGGREERREERREGREGGEGEGYHTGHMG